MKRQNFSFEELRGLRNKKPLMSASEIHSLTENSALRTSAVQQSASLGKSVGIFAGLALIGSIAFLHFSDFHATSQPELPVNTAPSKRTTSEIPSAFQPEANIQKAEPTRVVPKKIGIKPTSVPVLAVEESPKKIHFHDVSGVRMMELTADEAKELNTTLYESAPAGNRKAIPIFVLEAHGSDGKIFWITPTPASVECLPIQFRLPLQNELNILEELEKKCLTHEQACEETKGAPTFFDICRTSGGAVSDFAIYPNPVRNQVHCAFSLSVEREFTFTIHTPTGRFIRRLGDSYVRTAGKHTISLESSGLEKGMYLLVLTTATGEQAMQRMIVE